MDGFEFFNSLMGDTRDARLSQDGKAVIRQGEIAAGIPMRLICRPSESSEVGIDASIDGTMIRHIEGTPKF